MLTKDRSQVNTKNGFDYSQIQGVLIPWNRLKKENLVLKNVFWADFVDCNSVFQMLSWSQLLGILIPWIR